MLLATISEAVQAADRLVGSRYPQRSSKSNNHIDVFLIALATWHLWVWLFVPLRSVSKPDLVATLPFPILSDEAADVCCCVLQLPLTDHMHRSQGLPEATTATESGGAHQWEVSGGVLTQEGGLWRGCPVRQSWFYSAMLNWIGCLVAMLLAFGIRMLVIWQIWKQFCEHFWKQFCEHFWKQFDEQYFVNTLETISSEVGWSPSNRTEVQQIGP